MELQGNIFDYFIVFGWGVLVSFTPCVYPIMPIVAGAIAGMNTKGSRFLGFAVSLVYVLGLAVTYSALAAFAALSGKIFGQWQNHPIVFLGVANILIFFALVMFDVVQIPSLGVSVQQRIKPKNLGMVFLLGAASGLVVGPCTAPILGTLLLYVASRQNIFHGISLLFFFAYGVGASLILVGTFSGLLGHLPRSGRWLVRIKQISGLILLIMAEYLIIKAGQLM